jgi:anaerobic ribonucleoside-triphosphate reductase activating protein
MKYAGLIKNDMSAAPGVSVSFFTQGCPHRCRGCHNPETWDFEKGKEFTSNTLDEIIEALTANGVQRSLAVMGGEPLCQENSFLTYLVVKTVKEKLPDTKVYIWTGYYYEDLIKRPENRVRQILELTDVIIDGPYVESLRDVTLPMRGSSNQSIIQLTKKYKYGII